MVSGCRVVFTILLSLAGVTCLSQRKGDPQLADSKIRIQVPITWKTVLEKDDTGLIQIGTIAKPEKGTAKNPFWSVGCECLDRDYARFESYKPYLAELGAGYARLMSGWAKTEKVKGQYEFEWLDEHVDGVIEEGLTPWLCLCYGNNLYSDSGTMLFSDIISSEETLVAWEKYVEAIAQRYKGRISMYEIWNEPNHGRPKRSRQDVGKMFASYRELCFRTVRAIRKHDSKVAIAGGSLGTYLEPDFPVDFISYLKEKGMEKEMEYVTFHPYGTIPEKRLDEIRHLRDSLALAAPWVKLLEGEVGIRSVFDAFLPGFISNEYCQEKWVLRQMAMEFGLGIPTSIFSMIDNRYPHKLQSYGMLAGDLLGRVLYKRPQFHGYQNMASILDKDAAPGPELNVSVRKTQKRVFSATIARNGAVKGIIIWFGGEIPTDSMRKDRNDVFVEGLDLVNPVYADPATGRVFKLEKYSRNKRGMKFKNLPLWDSPIMILEESSIRMKSVRLSSR